MKKVLVIAYYFPPCGGISIIRPLKIIKHLRSFGWEPILVTPKNAHYPTYDNALLHDFPKDIERIEIPIWEPYSLFKKFTARKNDDNVNNVLVVKDKKSKQWKDKLAIFIRSNFFIPDARKFWIKPSVRTLTKYLKENHIDAILTTGPPHSSTLIGAKLKEKLNIPLLADFQDPWTQIDYYKELILTPWANKYHHKLEQYCFQQADATTIVSNSWKKDLENIGAKNVHTIPLGFDPEHFKEFENITSNNSFFTMLHLGMAGHDRIPMIFLESIIEVANEHKEFKSFFRLQFVGQVDQTILDFIDKHKNTHLFEHIPPTQRKDALIYGKKASILLLLLNKADNSSGRIPGKLFEYLALNKNILLLGNTKGDSADIIKETNMGECFEYENKEQIKMYLRNSFENWFTNKATSVHRNKAYLNYTSERLVGEFSKLLDVISK